MSTKLEQLAAAAATGVPCKSDAGNPCHKHSDDEEAARDLMERLAQLEEETTRMQTTLKLK